MPSVTACTRGPSAASGQVVGVAMGAVPAVGARGIGVEALSPRDRQCDVLGVPRVGDLDVHLDALHRATNE
jgi:hypothetical protein